MDYTISEEQRMLAASLRDLLDDVMPQTRFRQICEDGDGFSPEAWRDLAAGGWLGILALDPNSGEAAGSTFDLTRAAELVGARLFPGPFSLVAALIVPLLTRAREVQGLEVDALIDGSTLATMILPRPSSSEGRLEWNWDDVRVTGQENGRVRIAGASERVLFAQFAQHVLVPVHDPSGGVSIAVVPLGRDGVAARAEETLDPSRRTAGVEFEDVWVAKDEFVGGWGADYGDELVRWLERYLVCGNGESVGGAAEVLYRTVRYVTERKQFGVPVGSFQAVKHMLADASNQVELARTHLYHLAWKLDNDFESSLDVACSRVYVADMYKAVCERAIQCHGGFGFTWEQGVHFWYKAALFNRSHPVPGHALRPFILEAGLRGE